MLKITIVERERIKVGNHQTIHPPKVIEVEIDGILLEILRHIRRVLFYS